MAVIMQPPLCMYKLERSVIYVDDRFLPHNVVFRLLESLHDGIHILIISGVFMNCI